MKYQNAETLLPPALLQDLQRYISAGYLYIPAKIGQHKSWGEKSGSRKALAERNEKIRKEYGNGTAIEVLAQRYFLSEHTIHKIIYQK